jgi:hypothetical protein
MKKPSAETKSYRESREGQGRARALLRPSLESAITERTGLEYRSPFRSLRRPCTIQIFQCRRALRPRRLPTLVPPGKNQELPKRI